jgi:beta-lactamase regulating signal transducer with metallopeptidase domain
MSFKITEEFDNLAKELYNIHKESMELTVDPSRVVFMRSDKKKRAYAYCKVIGGEYQLLTNKRFFIVIISENFDNLKTDEERRYVILHELMHLHYNDEKDKYNLLKHTLEDFHALLINPKWNLDIMRTKKKEIIENKV